MHERTTWICCLLLIMATATLAIPVDHDDSQGIAAVTVHVGLTHATGYVAAVALGTDGKLYLLNEAGAVLPYKAPYGTDLSWPVPFKDIVDWTPLPFPLPDTDDYFLHPGLILCRDGSRWMTRAQRIKGGWDMAGEIQYDIEWVKIQGLTAR